MLLVLLSPLVIYGTWYAAFVYAGNSTAENMRALALMYRFHFEVFGSLEFAVPAISLDPIELIALAGKSVAYLIDLPNINTLDPVHFLEGARSLLALSSMLSIVKGGLAALAAGFALMKWTCVLPNVQFSACATWDSDYGDDYAKKMQELVGDALPYDESPARVRNMPRAATTTTNPVQGSSAAAQESADGGSLDENETSESGEGIEPTNVDLPPVSPASVSSSQITEEPVPDGGC